jgi:opacity protein-like surface antigen
MKTLILAALAAASLSACATAPQATNPQDVFLARLNALCGQKFVGRVVTTDAADADFANNRLLMHVRDCSPTEVGIPFAVGEDRSRRWIITRTDAGLRLKHDHRDPQGVIHGYHMYGGDTVDAGTAGRQQFPVDQDSIQQFIAGDAQVSTTNVWAVEVHPDRIFAYELRRPSGRFLRVEFDLTRPVAD